MINKNKMNTLDYETEEKLRDELSIVIKMKDEAVFKQDYITAANLRDREKEIYRELNIPEPEKLPSSMIANNGTSIDYILSFLKKHIDKDKLVTIKVEKYR